jgi:hypothetical protein
VQSGAPSVWILTRRGRVTARNEMRTVFLAYLLIIATGLAFATVIGLGHH